MREKMIVALRAPTRSFRKLYDWTIRWSHTKKAPYALFAIAFAESSFFPIPPDVVLIPMTVAHRKYWLRNAVICTLGSVLGGLFGYLIGWGLYEIIGKPIVDFYNLSEAVASIGQRYKDHAFLTIFGAAFTPIPYKAFTIAAGLFIIPIPTLVIASILGRAGRFFAIAFALKLFGKKIEESIEKYFDIISILFLVLLIGGVLAVKYL